MARKTKVAKKIIEEEPVVEDYGARVSAVKVCPFCKHSYLKPCTDKTKDSCPNYKFLQRKSKGRKK